MNEGKNFRIVLEPELKSKVVAIFDEAGISQQEAMRRMFTWFCEQTDVIQREVLQQTAPSIRSDIGIMILTQMATSGQDAALLALKLAKSLADAESTPEAKLRRPSGS